MAIKVVILGRGTKMLVAVMAICGTWIAVVLMMLVIHISIMVAIFLALTAMRNSTLSLI
ncbi:hypothetical protein [Vibrio parahaemolyticus]|uniref:hypothetical protein n=1 Tax=Vibrio parahaemolyticus TaxID=670 RepID=UPI001C5938BA|nr:hypothetical protein [Vibrio parahaemolyticus]